MTTTFVALLRGVNLGPSKKISMPQLRSLVSELGFAHVRTYINSGNVILSSAKPAEKIEQEISEAISDTFGHRVDVIVRSAEQLQKVVGSNPFPDGDPSQVTVAFLVHPPDARGMERLAEAAPDHEPYLLAGREVYVNYTQGIGTSKLAATFGAVIGVSATVRNLRTVAKLVELTS